MSDSDPVELFEKQVDYDWKRLKVLTLPYHFAIFHVLSTYEEWMSDQAPASGIPDGRHTLAKLVPLIISERSKKPTTKKDLRNIRQRVIPREYGIDSIKYASRYQWVGYLLTGWHLGWFSCQIQDKRVCFSDLGPRPALSLMHHSIKNRAEQRIYKPDKIRSIAINSPPEQMKESLTELVRHTPILELLKSIPIDIINIFKEIVLASSPASTLDPLTRFEDYSLSDYHAFWIDLSAICFAYLEACKIKYNRNALPLRNSRVILTDRDELTNIICKLGPITPEACANIITSLILDSKSKRPDIQVRPIIPIDGTDLLMIAPSLIYTSNWEVCLLRNWGKNPGLYGSLIANQKVGLENELLSHLSNDGITSRDVTVTNGKGQSGDIDVAVFNRDDGCLLAVQCKWVIEPDSIQEESNAMKDIEKGTEQLRVCNELFVEDPGKLLSSLFPGEKIKREEIIDVYFIVVCRGEVESRTDPEQYGVQIIESEWMMDFLSNHKEIPLGEKTKALIQENILLERNVESQQCYSGMKLSGYGVLIPSLKNDRISHSSNVKPSMKNRCPCGSGIQYKDCCYPVEGFVERQYSIAEVRDTFQLA